VLFDEQCVKLYFLVQNFLPFVDYIILMQEKISGSPRFSVLQATKSWAGPRNEALICLRTPFVKMVALPSGKQRAIHWTCSQRTHRPETCVYPSSEAAIPSSDGANEAQEEAV